MALMFIVQMNFILCFFNMLPVPLDGGHVAEAFMPYKHRAKFEQFAKYGPFIILGVMLIPQVGQVFAVPARWCTEGLYRAFLGLFA
jgi:Zn-dependent protease